MLGVLANQLIDSQVVILMYRVEEAQHIVLGHGIITGCHLLGLIHAELDLIKAALQQVQGGYQGSDGDTGHLGHDGLLHVALNSLQHGAITYPAKGMQSQTFWLSSSLVVSFVGLLMMIMSSSSMQDISLMTK